MQDEAIRALYDTLDIDGNGILSSEELAKFLDGRHALSSGKGGGDDLHDKIA